MDVHIYEFHEELRKTAARIYGECEVRTADELNIGQLDDGTYSVSVEWVELDEGSTWGPAWDIYRDSPCFSEQATEDAPVSNQEAGFVRAL